MQFNLEKYWKQKMSPEEKKEIERLKTLKVRNDIPKDLSVAISSFMQQVIITGEHELDHIPSEYMENLLRTLAKYPEHSMLFNDLVEILQKSNLMD